MKHQIHIIGLISEALMLAGDKVSTYPMMSELEDFFESQLKSWLDTENNHAGDDEVKKENRLEIATAIRVKRKELVKYYWLGEYGPGKIY